MQITAQVKIEVLGNVGVSRSLTTGVDERIKGEVSDNDPVLSRELSAIS
jgi:hypothetical protein